MAAARVEGERSRIPSTPEMEEDLATLCQSCGLCCDGSLFGRVPLEAKEVEPARRKHLRVLESGKAFEQPCTALVPLDGGGERRTCSIYRERPRSCHRFVCRLYDRHRHEGGPLEPRLSAVQRVRELASYLEESGLTMADLENERASIETMDPSRARAMHAFEELVRRLEGDFARADEGAPPR